jgi:RsiW-degrading membrane proteinase PrsW (M82 family)
MSGSGKSSLVMAGLIPALNGEYVIFRPGTNPLGELESVLASVKENALIVVDQFEEMFTLTSEETMRKEFIAKLLETTKRYKVVITLRSDFLGEVALYRALSEEIQNHLEIVPPMDMDELYHAMEGQADSAGLRFEADLGKQILDDVEGEPGAMPLLQHALWMLWKRRHGSWLMSAEYRAFGGIQRAIATTADELYETFAPEDRERMRNVFVRLTRLDQSGQAARDARRRVRVNDLIYPNDTLAQTMDFIRRLTNARLLITSSAALQNEEVEVAHEALIRNWPRLRGWLDEDRLSLLVQEDIREAASMWDASDHDSDAIVHRGGKLEDALHLMRNPRAVLSALETRYLDACEEMENKFVGFVRNALTQLLPPVLLVALGMAAAYYFGESMVMAIALVIATVIPLLTVWITYRQDRYRIIELKWIVVCLLGGVLSYSIAARINPALRDSGILSKTQVIRFAVPILETAFKGLVLYVILSRLKFSRTVDGVIYGIAVGAGYAIVENYEYVLGYRDIAIVVALARTFSTNFVHMGVTGLSGYLLSLPQFNKIFLTRMAKILFALFVPSIIHVMFNTMVNSGIALFIAIAFGLLMIGVPRVIITRLVKQDEKWIEQFLQGNTEVSGSSAVNNIQQIIKTIRSLFGNIRAAQLERFLILQARRGILQKAVNDMDDPKLKTPIEEQLNTVKKIRGTRGAIGTYCWENVKAVIPEVGRIAEN